MSKKVYSESNIAAVANAIREKTGTENSYKTSEMPDGIAAVYEAGKKSEYDAFWDAFQDNGRRQDYSYAFINSTEGWLRPKHGLVIITGDHAFDGCKVKNLEENLQQCGKKIQFGSQWFIGTCQYVFYNAKVEIVPELSVTATTVKYFFANCKNMKTIRKLTVDEFCPTSNKQVTDWSNAFAYCNALENITFGGEIAGNISFKHSPLTIDSVKSVITHLKDYTGSSEEYTGSSEEYTCTVTFKTTAFEALEADGEASPNGNTWAEYIDDLKWNLTLA